MTVGVSPTLAARYRQVSGALAAAAIAVGVGVIGGWLLGLPRLTDYFPTAPEAKFNAGVCLVLCGLSLWLQHAGPPAPRARVAAQALAGAATLVAFLTAIEHLFGWDLGLDQLVVRAPPGGLGARAPSMA